MAQFFQKIVAGGLGALFTAGFIFASAPATASAQDQAPAVARLSVADGNISIQHGDSGQAVAGTVNAPLEPGDYLSTGSGSRAEVQLDAGNALRAAGNTQLRLTQIGPAVAQVAEGTVELRTFNTGYGTSEIDTPNASIRPESSGAYLVTVNADGSSDITVRSGSATVSLGNATQNLTPGSTLYVTGSAQDPQYSYVGEVAYDNFDRWNQSRDQLIASANPPYVNSSVIGTYDLNNYGQWVNYPSYGEVWVPYESPGWAPYRNGRWVWEGYYGWTWVGDEPWGWAPYHYGRWFYANDVGWCWYPGGPAYISPVWQPALVAFFGFGGGGISIGFGNIGWVPLAPYEPFHPWWGGWGGNNVAIINNTTIVNNITIYRNIHAPGGLDAVPYRGWVNGDFTHRIAAPRDLRQLAVVHGIVPVVPTHNDLRFRNRVVASAMLPRTATTRFASFTRPNVRVPSLVSFAQQQHAVKSAQQHFAAVNQQRIARLPDTRSLTQSHPLPAGTTTGFVQQTHAPVQRVTAPHYTAPTQQRTVQGGAWSRFTSARPNTAARPAAPSHYTAPVRRVTAPYAAPAQQRTVPSGAWARFNSARPTIATHAAAPSHYAEPVQRVTAPHYTAPARQRTVQSGVWGRFTTARPNAVPQRAAASHYVAPQRPSYAAPRNSAPAAPRYSPPQYARPTYSAPHYSAPAAPRYSPPQYARPTYSAPHYSAPAAPRYSPPQYARPTYSAPHYSAPHYSAPRQSSGGGGRPQPRGSARP
jgi:hypothetical protein